MFKWHLDQLRRLSAEKNTDAITAMAYFINHIAASVILRQHEKFFGIANPFYSLVMPVAKYFGNQVSVTSMLIYCLKAHHFVCGIAEFSNQLVAILYFFEDTQAGIATVSPLSAPMKFFKLLENK